MSAFNEFLRNSPEWIFYISFAGPLLVLSILVPIFDRRRKKVKAIRQAHKTGLIQKRSERHPNLDRSGIMVTKVSTCKDVPSDYFDRVSEFRASL
ncbi:gp052 [Rhodococcus phage ReqiPoco6]|uniref:Gp052 n=1 Tax=Rhodococcus phage ReqiPoco6 TaxID=691964 RepID=D4P7S0_9CAUD|nr:gp052 [Rhodococcus phage ReqiPoco6]ADD81050.1 gp052 [Rhodococcus phage ReqiPoco6]